MQLEQQKDKQQIFHTVTDFIQLTLKGITEDTKDTEEPEKPQNNSEIEQTEDTSKPVVDESKNTNVNCGSELQDDKFLIFGFIRSEISNGNTTPVDVVILVTKYLNYNYLYWSICGNNISIDRNTITKINDSWNKHCAYGTRIVSKGIHEWRLKVNKCRSPKKFSIIIGVSSDTTCLEECVSYGNSNYYGYKSDGTKVCPPFNYQGRGIPKFYANDIITVHLNLDELLIYFSESVNKRFGYQNIQAGRYRLVVRLKSENDSVTLLSYQERDNEEINYNNVSFSNASKMVSTQFKRQYR